MLDVLYWTAAALALVAAIYSVRAARSVSVLARAVCHRPAVWALLASAAFCLGVRWTGLEFNRALWIAVDLAVMAAVAWPMVPIVRARAWPWLAAYRKEMAILVLFPLMWAAYELPGEQAYIFTTIASAAQLLLTLPFALIAMRAGIATRSSRMPRDPFDEFDIRVAA